jgi:outer membrane protein insertion porin family
MRLSFVRRVSLWLIAISATVVALVAAAHLPFVRARMLDWMRTRISNDLGITLQADALRYNLAARSVELVNPIISARNERPFLEADAVRIVLDRRLFRGMFEPERVDLSRPRVTIVRHRDGTFNLPVVPEDASTEASPIVLGTVAIGGFRIELIDEAAGHRFTAGPIDLTFDSRPPGRPGDIRPSPLALTLGPLGERQEAKPISATVAGRLGFDGTRLSVPELRVEAPEARLELQGWADLITDGVPVKALVRLQTSVAHLSDAAGSRGLPLTGSLVADIELEGTAADPTARFMLRAEDLRYGSLAPTAVRVEGSYASGRLTTDLTAASELGMSKATGTIVLAGSGSSPEASRIDAYLEGVDLDRALRLAGLPSTIPLGSTAGGHLQATLRAHPFDAEAWRTLDARGSIRFQPATAGLSVEGVMDVGFHDGRWTMRHEIRSAPAHAAFDGNLSGEVRRENDAPLDSTVSGRSRLRIDDLSPIVPLMRSAAISLPVETISGVLDISVESRGTFTSPGVVATVSGRGLSVTDFPAGEVDSTLVIDRRAISTDALEARLGAVRVTAAGEYSWSGRIDSRFEAATDDLTTIVREMAGDAVELAGSMRVAGTVEGDVRSLRGRATLTAGGLTAYGVAAGSVTGTLQLEDRRLGLEARAPTLAANLRAGLELDEPYSFQAEAVLDGSSIPALLPAANAEAPTGTITADMRAKGTLRQPWQTAGQVALRALELTTSGIAVRLSAPATIEVDPAAVSATPLNVRIGRNTEATLRGSLGLDSPRDGMELAARGPLDELLALGSSALAGLPVASESSTVNLDLHVGGTLRAPQPHGTLSVAAESLRYGEWPPLTGAVLDARIEREGITIPSLRGVWQEAALTLSGVVPWRVILPEAPVSSATSGFSAWASHWLASLPDEPRTAALDGSLTGITTTALLPFVESSRQLDEIDGVVDASVSAEADALALDRLRASLVLDRAALTVAGVPIAQSVPTRLTFERGRAALDQLRWDAEGNELTVTGGVDVTAAPPQADLAISGALDLRVLGAFTDAVASGGVARPSLSIKGSLTAPDIAGEIGISGGEIRLEAPPLAAAGFDGTIAIVDRAARISLSGLINGGPAAIAGVVDLDQPASPRGRINLSARNVFLEYPEGLQTESEAELALTLDSSGMALGGRVNVSSAIYREPIVVSRTLLARVNDFPVSTVASESTFLSDFRLDVTLASLDEIRVDNNYGRLNFTANLQITGTADRPGVIGRIEAAPDGEIYLAGNTYRVQTLIVDLANPRAIAPDVTFLAETRVGRAPIEIALQCSASGSCEREIRSQTAQFTNEEAERLLFGISSDPTAAGTQLARLLSGELLGIVGRSVGLDTLRLEQDAGARSDLFDDPTLVAGDVNPASRLTLGKRLGDRVELVYSQDLAQNGFLTSTSYLAPVGISARALLFDDQSRSLELRHQPLGGASPSRRPPRRDAFVTAVRFSGNPGLGEDALRRQLRLTEGDRFDFAAWQADRERIGSFYQSRGFVEARVRAQRTVEQRTGRDLTTEPRAADDVTLEYAIEPGRQTRLEVTGFDLPADVRGRIVQRWASAIFDGFLERDAALIVRDYLYREGRLHASVAARISTGDRGEVRTLRIDITPGAVATPLLQFEGNAALSSEMLLEAAGSSEIAAWIDPRGFAAAIERLYHQQGFLSARANVGPPEARGETSVVRVEVREGEPWTIGRVTVGGTEALSTGGAVDDLMRQAGGRYTPAAVGQSVASLEQRFRDAGFLDVRVAAETVLDRPARRADVHVLVASGPRSVLSGIEVEGAGQDDQTITRRSGLTAGAAAGAAALSAARRRLYEAGTYRSVEIDLEPVPAARPSDDSPLDRAVVAHIRVEERPRYTFRYGLAFNDNVVGPDTRDRRVGFAADLENRNLFDRGATVGLSARLRRDQTVGRVYLGANRFFGIPLRSNLFLSRTRQDIGSDEGAKTVSDITEISAEQAYSLRRVVELRYGYELGRNRTTLEGSDFDLTVRVARLTTSGLVDRRNDPFDPVRGSFTAASLELSRPGLGSELSFLRTFLQRFQFRPIGDGVVFAAAARLGLARTFRGETLIPSERFFAGGATSVRGYRENDLGPRSIFGDAEGGPALSIVNAELRFPIYRWLRGVGFVDLGNVYPAVADLLRSGMQAGAGGGLRLNTPVGLLRLDLAVPVNRRPFDPQWSAHFGLGHAF